MAISRSWHCYSQAFVLLLATLAATEAGLLGAGQNPKLLEYSVPPSQNNHTIHRMTLVHAIYTMQSPLRRSHGWKLGPIEPKTSSDQHCSITVVLKSWSESHRQAMALEAVQLFQRGLPPPILTTWPAALGDQRSFSQIRFWSSRPVYHYHMNDLYFHKHE